MIIYNKEGFPFEIFPKFYFLTPKFHANVNGLGKVSKDILESQLSPNLIIGKIIISIQSHLDVPNPCEFLNVSVAKLNRENICEYKNVVR